MIRNEEISLFRLLVRVTPAASHSMYWESAGGVLCIFLTDKTAESAVVRCRAILAHLPYELIDSKYVLGVYKPEAVVEEPAQRLAIDHAQQVGVGLIFYTFSTGTESKAPHFFNSEETFWQNSSEWPD